MITNWIIGILLCVPVVITIYAILFSLFKAIKTYFYSKKRGRKQYGHK